MNSSAGDRGGDGDAQGRGRRGGARRSRARASRAARGAGGRGGRASAPRRARRPAKLAALTASADARASGRGQRAGDQRPGGEAGVARALDPAVGLRQVARHDGHERRPRPGPATAAPAPSSAVSGRIAREPVREHEPGGDHRLRERDEHAACGASRCGPRACPRAEASSAIGAISAANSAATAKPDPVRSCTRSESTTTRSRSPAAETAVAPASRRRSRIGLLVPGLDAVPADDLAVAQVQERVAADARRRSGYVHRTAIAARSPAGEAVDDLADDAARVRRRRASRARRRGRGGSRARCGCERWSTSTQTMSSASSERGGERRVGDQGLDVERSGGG